MTGGRRGVGVVILIGMLGWGSRSAGADPVQAPPAAPGPAVPVPKPAEIPELERAAQGVRQGRLDEALTQLKQAVAAHPELPPPRVVLALLLFQANQAARGRLELEQAADEAPAHPEVYAVLGKLALAERRLTEAGLDFEKAAALPVPPGWPDAKTTVLKRTCFDGLAAVAEARRDWAGARDQLRRWLDLEPTSGAARQRLAQALFGLGQPAEAFRTLQQAARDDPKSDPPGVIMARLYLQAGDRDRAQQWADRAVRDAPDDPRAHLARAGLLLEQGRADEAQDEARAAAKLAPDLPDVRRLRGMIARYRRDYLEAERQFQALLEASPGDPFAGDQLAQVLAEQDDEAKRRRAVELAEVNARQYPNVPQALATLAWANFRAGRAEPAERALQAAASVTGGSVPSETAYVLARILAARGRPDDARKLLEAALAAPGSFFLRQDARRLLEQLPAPPAAIPKEAAPGGGPKAP